MSRAVRIGLWLLLLWPAAVGAHPPVPPAAQLLPSDTLGLLSVPDWDKATAYWNQSPQGKLWHDPALKALREKVTEKWHAEIAQPLEVELGIKFSDYADLLHGQLSLAVIQNNWGKETNGQPGWLLLVDTKDKHHALHTRLAELKKKWADSGRPLKTEK